MPRRKPMSRASNSVTPREIEALRAAINEGYPWILHQSDVFRQTGLSIRLNILLSYITGISAGVSVFLSGEDHPTPATVEAVKAELQADIDAAEKRYKKIFTGKKHKDGFFRYLNPHSPKRNDF